MFCCSIFSTIAVLILLAAIVLKLFIKLTTRQNGCMNCLVGKTVIVTGANTGIGFEAALDFAKRGAKVILACRNQSRAEDAVFRIKKATGNENVHYKILDLTSLKSVREFAANINSTEERLDILVNNAGGMCFGNHITEDGLQITLQTNHVAPFLLTHLLIDKLKKSGPSRIVNVSSLAAKYAKICDIKMVNKYPEGRSFFAAEGELYCNSKLYNVLFTTELSKRLDGSVVTVNALHTGAINSEFSSRHPQPLKTIFDLIGKMYFKSSTEGAQTTIYVSLAKELDGVSGKMFDNCREIAHYKTVSEVLAKELWKQSEEFAKLKSEERLKF